MSDESQRLVGADRNSPAPVSSGKRGHSTVTDGPEPAADRTALEASRIPRDGFFMGQKTRDVFDELERTLLQLRPKTSAERKAEPIHSGVLMYFPDALAAVARWSVIGNAKHNPGEPLHWARGKSMDQMDAMIRHSLTRDKMDPDGELEAVPLVWRALAELQLLEEKRLHAAGIMPYSGVTS